MENINDYLTRVAESSGFVRERYIEKNIPTSYDAIAVIPFFGDLESQFLLSSFLLHRFKDELPTKYLIMASYPGCEGLYPYIDEVWGVRDTGLDSLWEAADGFGNNSQRALHHEQQLNRYVRNVYSPLEFKKYYNNGFTSEFFDKYRKIVFHLPSVPSPGIDVSRKLARESSFRAFFRPNKMLKRWYQGRERTVKCPIQFWQELAKQMSSRGITPVVLKDENSYDISSSLLDKGIYCKDSRMSELMGIMRSVGCTLDFFDGMSKIAILARCPFVVCTERHLYNIKKEYEIDDLCCNSLPYKRVFSFTNIIEDGRWQNLINLILNKLEEFIPHINRDELPSTSSSLLTVPYSQVREIKKHKMGIKFIKVQKIGEEL